MLTGNFVKKNLTVEYECTGTLLLKITWHHCMLVEATFDKYDSINGNNKLLLESGRSHKCKPQKPRNSFYLFLIIAV